MLPHPTIPPPPDDANAPWMPVARSEVGVHELNDLGELNPRLLDYFRATTFPLTQVTRTTKWCGAFVSWCLLRGHVQSPRTAAAEKFLTYGRELQDVEYGCIVVLHHHVCFAIEQQGTEILTLDGNSNNRVRYASHEKKDVIGLRWPLT